MNILTELQDRFRTALAQFIADPSELVQMVRPSQDPMFGDYQANCAMPLAKSLGRSPREVAAQIVEHLRVEDLCESPEVAGPGFINLRLKTERLTAELKLSLGDERLGIAPARQQKTYVIDYSGPNVAKSMHVGHIRSTVIGDCLDGILRFLGHRVISDNHIGDWGTQFGMIIYGFKQFRNDAAYRDNPVEELGRLYRLVNRLVDDRDARASLPRLQEQIACQEAAVHEQRARPIAGDKAAEKEAAKALRRADSSLGELRNSLVALRAKIADVESDPILSQLARQHPEIGAAVLAETAKLHAGDPENRRLWQEFLPPCREQIERLYGRLGVSFDYTLGESFYHDRLAQVVEALRARGIARESDGAICIFLDGQPAPLIIRKQDGAFLYATSDLATLEYRMQQWSPDAILYVVDHRQSLHFQQLFAAARLWGYRDVELVHVSFGTVLGEDGRPFKTRSGDTVGLEGLLDEAVRRAEAIVCAGDDAQHGGPEMSRQRQLQVAEVVGIGALKYADLSQNRTSDYVFSYDKMLAMNGNTATYMQYAYARVLSIFAKGEVEIAALRADAEALEVVHPAERALAVALLQFSEALQLVVGDYRPNYLTNYLFELANRYSTFFEQCPVLRAETPQARHSRLLLCDLTARTLKQGLALLGIQVVDRM